jgi:uncharacterized protein (TIGR02145 family)
MKKFVRNGLTLLLAAVLAVVGAFWLSGVSMKPAPEPQIFGSVSESEINAKIVAEEVPDAPPDTNSFTDSRGAVTYKTAKIGGKTWLAENLRYRAKNSWCYDDDSSNCDKYGRLYAWNTAKTACPTGWHLPTRLEWLALSEAVGGEEAAGKRLKARTGWDENGNGNDWYGFSALPGGNRHPDAGDFGYAGSIGFWWTSTEYGSGNVYIRTMNYGDNDVGESYTGKNGGLSVRCVQDD